MMNISNLITEAQKLMRKGNSREAEAILKLIEDKNLITKLRKAMKAKRKLEETLIQDPNVPPVKDTSIVPVEDHHKISRLEASR